MPFNSDLFQNIVKESDSNSEVVENISQIY